MDPQLLLKTYHMPESQLKRNWDTYRELLMAGMPADLPDDWVQYPLISVTQIINRMQGRLKDNKDGSMLKNELG